MSFTLKRSVAVSPDPDREDAEPGRVYWLQAGTALDELPESEVAQLAPEHFEDVEDPSAVPEEWRTNPATLEHDARQHKANRAEADERAKAKAKRNRNA